MHITEGLEAADRQQKLLKRISKKGLTKGSGFDKII